MKERRKKNTRVSTFTDLYYTVSAHYTAAHVTTDPYCSTGLVHLQTDNFLRSV